MTIGSVGFAPYIPPTQASVERLNEAAAPPVFRRPEISQRPRTDPRLLPRQPALTLVKSTAMKRLLEDAGAGQSSLSEQLAALDDHLRTGGRLNTLLKPGDILQSSLLYILASELAVHARSTDATFASYIESEVAILMSAKGEEINAAINSAKAFSEPNFAPAADRRWFRAGYLAVVSSQGSVAELLESLLIRFGPAGFQKGALVLLQGINDDLTSASPSIRPGKLHILLLSSLVSLRHLTAFVRATATFIKRNKYTDQRTHADERQGVDEVSAREHSGQGRNTPDKRNHNDGSGEANDGSAEEEAMTVRTFLQLIAGQGSIKLVQGYLEEHFGRDLDRSHKERIFKDFIAFVQGLPLTMWRERGHKDRLLEALRRQLLVDQLDKPITR